MMRSRGVAWWATLILWLVAFLVIAGDVTRRPNSHTTTPTYRLASTNWWAGIDPYTYNTNSGFLYFPQAAILYTPFTWGSILWGDLLWRAAVFALFAYALVRLARFFVADGGPVTSRTFLLLTLLAVPSSLASLRNAQFDLPLAALILLATAEIAEARWTAATLWLCLAIALKPLAVVPLLLFGALYFRALLPRLALGLAITLLVPFLNPHPAFVAHEYHRCLETLLWATQSHEPKFSDLGALLQHIHVAMPNAVGTALRLIFALTFLGLGAWALQRRRMPDAAWCVGGAGGGLSHALQSPHGNLLVRDARPVPRNSRAGHLASTAFPGARAGSRLHLPRVRLDSRPLPSHRPMVETTHRDSFSACSGCLPRGAGKRPSEATASASLVTFTRSRPSQRTACVAFFFSHFCCLKLFLHPKAHPCP